MSYFEPSPGLDVVIKPAFIEEISVISVVFGRKCAVEVIAKIIFDLISAISCADDEFIDTEM